VGEGGGKGGGRGKVSREGRYLGISIGEKLAWIRCKPRNTFLKALGQRKEGAREKWRGTSTGHGLQQKPNCGGQGEGENQSGGKMYGQKKHGNSTQGSIWGH